LYQRVDIDSKYIIGFQSGSSIYYFVGVFIDNNGIRFDTTAH